MRRALVAIPLAAALIGLFLLLWHAGVGSRFARPPALPPPAPARTGLGPGTGPESPGLPPRQSPPPVPRAPGSIRLFVHASGRALGGVRLVLVGESPADRRRAETPVDGALLLSDLAPGSWTVAARHPRFVPEQAGATVESGRTAEVTLELREGGRLHGTARDESGRPLEGIAVNVLHGVNRQFLHPDLSALTDAAGRYAIEGIPPSEVGVHLRSVRHRPWMRMGLLFTSPGDVHEVNAVLQAGTQVAGRVVDGASVPIEGANVSASNEFASIARTDAEGRFSLHGLGDEAINLSASARGYGTAFVRGVKPDTAGLEIRLHRGGTVAGRIAADPLPGSFAVILSRYDEFFRKEIRFETRTFSSAGGGEFAVQDVASGEYAVEVEAPGYEPLDRPRVVVYPGQTAGPVTVKLRKKR